jgi:ribosomal subunit interface protein
MKIQIRERDVEVTARLRAHVERRLGLALGRFGDKVQLVTVRFSRAHEPGNAVKRCQIDVGLRPRLLRAGDTDADLFAAVDHASDRVSRSVARALDLDADHDGVH